VIIVVAVLLVPMVRAIWVRDYGNRKLSEMPDYRAHVGAVTFHFWRGAYSVHNIKVVKPSQYCQNLPGANFVPCL